jgi:16S rRNA (guanine527-N7)-methyltransferase
VPKKSALALRLKQGLDQLDLALSEQQQEQLLTYLGLLQKWNKAYNLTAVRDPEEMLIKHILDSLSVASFCASAHSLLDIGAGAGLPCVVFAIVYPKLQIWGLDSNIKKTRFMQQVAYELRLENFQVTHARADTKDVTQTFDIVISRAFASLSDFFTLALPRLAPKGQIFAMKGRYPESELAEAASLCDINKVIPISVPYLSDERHLIIATAPSP